jgi:hypothetical protein
MVRRSLPARSHDAPEAVPLVASVPSSGVACDRGAAQGPSLTAKSRSRSLGQGTASQP